MGIRSNPLLKVLLYPIIFVAKFIGRNFPETLVRIRYFVRFRRFLNLKKPQTLNEKILYMSFRGDTSQWTRLADKYNVRGYIEECGLSDILVPFYGYWTNAADIDFNTLPKSFVFKTVQGCGDIIIVKDKNNIDKTSIISKLQKSIDAKYGELEGGKHYMRIPSAAIAEGVLINDINSSKHSSSIIDYKIWCFNGKPHFIMVCSNRTKTNTELMIYDLAWNMHPEFMNFNIHYKRGSYIPKPDNFEKMLSIAEKLSAPFPVVRVDLYNLDGKIYFGEMTFTSLGGLMNYYTDEFQCLAGKMIDVNYKG